MDPDTIDKLSINTIIPKNYDNGDQNDNELQERAINNFGLRIYTVGGPDSDTSSSNHIEMMAFLDACIDRESDNATQ